MTLRNYNISDNAVVDAAAGSITAGYAVCATPANTGYVVATTGNRAAIGTGWLSGIAISTASSGQQVAIVNSGHVDRSYVGTLAGTDGVDIYVDVTSTGALSRSSSIGADTIGHYEDDGGVWVNLALQAGGAVTGNATAIQAQTVTAASASVDRLLMLTSGGTLQWVPTSVYNVKAYGATGDGTTDDIGALEAAVSACPSGCKVFVPFGNYKITRPWRIWDDVAHGAKKNITIEFEQGPTLFGSTTVASVLTPAFSDYSGNAATISSVTNGGSGQVMMTLTGCTGITTAMASEIVGEPCAVWDSAAHANNNLSHSYVCAVPSDGTLVIYNPNAGATTDAATTIKWRVKRTAVDVRAIGTTIRGLCVILGAGQRLNTLLKLTEAPGASAFVISRCQFFNTLLSAATATTYFDEGLSICDSIVPTSGSSKYAVNGAGIPHVYNPTQVSECWFDDFRVTGCYRGAAAVGYSLTTGQAVQNLFTRFTPNQCRVGYGNPLSSVGSSYLCEAGFRDGLIGTIYCTLYDIVSSARNVVITGDRGELGSGRLLRDANGSSARGVTVRDGTYTLYGTPATAIHPTGELMRLGNAGPSVIDGVAFQVNANSHPWHVNFNGPPSLNEGKVTFTNNTLRGTNTWTGGRKAGPLVTTIRGPWAYADGDTLNITTTTSGAESKAISKANVETAVKALTPLSTYTANRDELLALELECWIRHYFTGATASGRFDNTVVELYSVVAGAAEGLQVTGGTLNTKLGFSTSVTGGSARSQVSKDTVGWIDRLAGSEPLELTMFGNRYIDASTGASIAMPSFVGRRYNSATIGGDTYATKKRGTVTHNAGGTTFTFTFATANLSDEADTTYDVIATPKSVSAAVATGGLQITTITKAVDKVDFTVAADPASGNVTWEVEIIR